jgi:hypothetical protein
MKPKMTNPANTLSEPAGLEPHQENLDALAACK